MKIAISGLHSQGKTTLINALKQTDTFKGFSFRDSPTRALMGDHLINESGTQNTQVSIMFNHYLNHIGKNIILDRCALDGLAYTEYFKDQFDYDVYGSMQLLGLYLLDQYDYIFYIKPELPLKEDGVRSTGKEFFESVKSNFENIILKYDVPVITVSGTVEQRLQTILNTYNN